MKTICLEGADFTGKTTTVMALRERLTAMGIKTLIFRQPGGTPIGERLRALLFDNFNDVDHVTQYALFTASRTAAANELTLFNDPEAVVILDRYVVSGYVYQRLRSDLIANARLQASINKLLGLSMPDHTFFLTCDDDTVRQRASTRSIKDTALLDRIDVALANKQAYSEIFGAYDDIHPGDSVHLLDSTKCDVQHLVDLIVSAAGLQ